MKQEDFANFSGYTLIMDEVINGVETIDISKDEVNRFINTSKEGLTIKINDDNSVEWIDDEYNAKEYIPRSPLQ